MEWFDTVKTWLTDNAVWLGALAAALAVLGGVLWAPLGFLKKIISNSSKDGGTPSTPPPTPTPTPNLPPNLDVYLNPLIDLARKNGRLEGEQEWAVEKARLLGTIEDLQSRSGPDAAAALEHLKSGETEQAKNLYREIAEAKAIEGASANSEAAKAYVILGAIAFLNDTEEALHAYAKATELDPDNADAWTRLGYLQQRKGLLDAADTSYNHVLSLGNRNKDKELEAISLGNLGLIAEIRGDLDAAEDFQKLSLALNEELGSKEGMAAALGNLGLIAKARGDLDAAEDFQNRSLALDEELGRKEGIANALGNLGLIAKARGDLDAAEGFQSRSLALEKELGRKEGMAAALGNLGTIAEMRGDLDAAEDFQNQSLALDEELGLKEGMANALGNLGTIAQTRGDLQKAHKLWTQAREIYTKIGMPHMVERVQSLIDSLLDDENSD